MKLIENLRKELEKNQAISGFERDTILSWMNRAYELGIEEGRKLNPKGLR